MDSRVEQLEKLVVKNHSVLKKKMTWEIQRNYQAIMTSLILSAKGVEADPDKYVECKKLLKSKASVFSEFRGLSSTLVITKMTLASEPETYLDGCLAVYKKLRAIHKLTSSPFMAMAAMTIYEHGGVEEADANIAKLEEFYKALQKEHPFLISDQDRGYLATLVTSGLDLNYMENSIESCYQACKSISINKDGVNSLAQILALSNKSSEAKAEEVKALIKGLKEAGTPVSKSYGLGALATLVLLNKSVEENVSAVSELSKMLKTEKAFKWYQMDKRTRTTFAILMDFIANSEEVNSNLAGNIGSTVAMAIIEDIIMAIIMLSIMSSRSSASGSSSSN